MLPRLLLAATRNHRLRPSPHHLQRLPVRLPTPATYACSLSTRHFTSGRLPLSSPSTSASASASESGIAIPPDGLPVDRLRTPAFLVSLPVVQRNTELMQKKALRLGLDLRPHVKTHKTHKAAMLQTSFVPKKRLAVSTLSEVRELAKHGFEDVLYTTPLAPQLAHEALDVVQACAQFAVMVDSREAVDALYEAIRARATSAVGEVVEAPRQEQQQQQQQQEKPQDESIASLVDLFNEVPEIGQLLKNPEVLATLESIQSRVDPEKMANPSSAMEAMRGLQPEDLSKLVNVLSKHMSPGSMFGLMSNLHSFSQGHTGPVADIIRGTAAGVPFNKASEPDAAQPNQGAHHGTVTTSAAPESGEMKRIRVFLKVDTGYGRAGVDPTDPESVALAEYIAGKEGLDFVGVYSHSGHSYYAAGDVDHIKKVHAEDCFLIARFAEQIRARGVSVPVVSVGSTPTCVAADEFPGVTEIHPGNYIFFDRSQNKILGDRYCSLDDVGVSVLTTVIGHSKKRGHLVVDAGSLALSKDTCAGDTKTSYGVVRSSNGPDLEVSTISQELATISPPPGMDSAALFAQCPIGTRLRILPNHSCLAAACHDRFFVLDEDDSKIISTWEPVSSRKSGTLQ